jgi:hypothetical protein
MYLPIARTLAAALALSLAASPAFAYIGPGAGLGAFGTVIAVIGAFLLLIVGFIWYPVKRLIRGIRSKSQPPAAENDAREGEH